MKSSQVLENTLNTNKSSSHQPTYIQYKANNFAMLPGETRPDQYFSRKKNVSFPSRKTKQKQNEKIIDWNKYQKRWALSEKTNKQTKTENKMLKNSPNAIETHINKSIM